MNPLMSFQPVAFPLCLRHLKMKSSALSYYCICTVCTMKSNVFYVSSECIKSSKCQECRNLSYDAQRNCSNDGLIKNSPERIRDTFSKELCAGVFPRVTAGGTHVESAYSGLFTERVLSYHRVKYTEEQRSVLRSHWHLPDSFCPAVSATGVVRMKRDQGQKKRGDRPRISHQVENNKVESNNSLK